MKRHTPLKSGGRIKPNRKRRDRTWKAAYGSEARVIWFHAKPCAICGEEKAERIVVAHLPSRSGMGKKSPYWLTVPAHAGACHDRLDRRGNAKDWLDDVAREQLYHVAEQLQSEWLEYCGEAHHD